jgi:uncharacterized membrane protein YbhN (UPF0104 family)/tRNA A-37 threonylcarbamoyl transferase component Bud32
VGTTSQLRDTSGVARRPSDLFGVILSAGSLGVLAALAHALPAGTAQFTTDVAQAVAHLPRLLMVALAAAAALGTLALGVVVAVPLATEDRRGGLNSLVAGLLTALLLGGAVALWHNTPGPVSHALLRGTDGSGFVRDAALIAALTAAGPGRRSAWSRRAGYALAVLVLTGVGIAELTGLGAIAAPLAGWAVGLLTRWAIGTTVRRPSVASLRDHLEAGGLTVDKLGRNEDDPSRLSGVLEDGTPVDVTALGPEARGANLARRFWSTFRLRGAAAGHQPLTVRAGLETRALANFLASSAEVRAPRTLLLTHVEPDTVVLVEAALDGPPLDESTPADDAVALFASLKRLHRAGAVHRDLRAEQLVCAGEASGFRSLERAGVASAEIARRVDVAQLLTAVGTCLGTDIAVEALRKGYQPADERRIAAILQPVALATWGWRRGREARACLGAVRSALLADPQDGAPLEVTGERLERFKWRTVAGVAAMTLAAYLLVGQLSKVNLIGALSHTDLAWVALAVLASAATYVGSSINLVAFVPAKVSVLKGTLAELSGAFIGLVTPPTVGHVAINARYLHKQGVEPAAAAGAVAVSQIVNFVVTTALLLVTALLTGSGVGRLNIVPGPRLLYVLGGLVAVVGLLVAVPPSRRALVGRLWPRIRGAVPQLLGVISQPLRLVAGISGNLLLTASYVVALIASLHAVGAHPPILATAAVYMAGNTVGTAAPTPGGIGAVEAVLAAGLTAVGIPAHQAVPAVLIFRVATFWLPILPGWATFVVLQRVGVI